MYTYYVVYLCESGQFVNWRAYRAVSCVRVWFLYASSYINNAEECSQAYRCALCNCRCAIGAGTINENVGSVILHMCICMYVYVLFSRLYLCKNLPPFNIQLTTIKQLLSDIRNFAGSSTYDMYYIIHIIICL